MNTFKNSYKGELYKITQNHTLLKLFIAILIFVIVISIFYSLIDNLIGDALGQIQISFEDNDEAINFYMQGLQPLESARENTNFVIKRLTIDRQIYMYKSQIAKYEYLKQNNLNAVNFQDYGSFGGTTASNFVIMNMTFISQILMIFAVVMCGKNLLGEWKGGTLKMQLLRPISRNKVFSSKYLSVTTVCVGTLAVSMVLVGVIAVLKFKLSPKQILYVLDTNKVFVTSPIVSIILEFFYNAIKIFAIIQFSYFVGNILRNRNASLSILIIILLIGDDISSFLGTIYIGAIDFIGNLNFMSALTTIGPIMPEMKLWGMLFVTIVWGSLMTFLNYKIFENRDIE